MRALAVVADSHPKMQDTSPRLKLCRGDQTRLQLPPQWRMAPESLVAEGLLAEGLVAEGLASVEDRAAGPLQLPPQ